MGRFWQWLGDLLVGAAETVAPVVETIGKIGLIGTGAALAVYGFVEFVGVTALKEIGAGIAEIGSDLGGALTDIASGLTDLVHALADGFGEFLDAIHYQTMMDVHEILWVLSAEYRGILRDVYSQISEVSEAIFGDTMTAHLIYQNTRSLLLSTSSMLGHEYDVSQVEWLKEWDGMLQSLNERSYHYKNHPEDIFYDLEVLADKNAVDRAGAAQQNVLGGIKGAIEAVNKTAQDLFQFKDDLGRWQASLPPKVREWTGPVINPVIGRIDTFQYDIYAPKMTALDLAIGQVSTNTENNKKRVDGLDLRLDSNPVYLGDWSKLDSDRRKTEQQNAQDEYTAPVQRDMDESHSVFAEKAGRMQQEARQKVKKPEPPPPAPEMMKYEPPETPGLKVGWWQKMGGDY